MTIDDLLADRALTANQAIAMRTAHAEDADGFERVIRKTSTASSPTAALVAAIQRGEHRSGRRKDTVRKRDKISTLDGAATYALGLHRAHADAYPNAEPEHHLVYAVDCAVLACQSRFDAWTIEEEVKRRLTQVQLRVGLMTDNNRSV